jgi:hypothetical protein
MKLIKYLLLGIIFGFIIIKAEVVSWYRIQEMFRFQSFHMYGIIITAIVVGMTSILLIKKMKAKTINGEEISIEPKKISWGIVIGGFIFGLGWAMTGACPGPLFALTGAGIYVMAIGLLSAIAGTYVYGLLSDKLP